MSSYLVTGATGYVGSMLIKGILAKEPDAMVAAIVRDEEKARDMLPVQVRIIVADLTDSAAVSVLDESFDYLIHCAAITQSRIMIAEPILTADSIVMGTRNVLAMAQRIAVKSMVYVSSMEIYGDLNAMDGERTDENILGTVDITKARSCYPIGKRMAEHYCFCFYQQYGLPIKIARLAQTFGSGVLETDQRVFAQFARSAQRGENIVLHTEGKSWGNYCAIDDVVAGILLLLEKGKAGEAYNLVNESCTMTIHDMAELVARDVASLPIKVVCDVPKDNIHGYAADTELKMSGEKLRKLGWKATKGLMAMYKDMIQSWQ